VRTPQTLIVILNWNGKKDTLECLASLAGVRSPGFATIVVDNGSSDDSVAAIRAQFPEVTVIENKANLGFAEGNNVGIRWALARAFQWIFLLNNDTVIAPDCLTEFLKATSLQPKGKIFGAKIFRYHDNKTIDHLGGYWDPAKAEFFSHASGVVDDGASYEGMRPVDYVCGAALLMHRSVPETIGLLEPRFFLFWEETDFCYRAQRSGFEVWTAPKAHIWHKVSASFTGGKPHTHYFWWRSRLLWLKRNCTHRERRHLYRSVIWPALWKEARHWMLSVLRNNLKRLMGKPIDPTKQLRYRAGLLGAFHYAIDKWGNCPTYISSRSATSKTRACQSDEG
jgi:GT2 family glycosyltransferase